MLSDKIRNWCDGMEAVFISGFARSGTSMIYRTLALHRDLWYVKGVPETFAFSRLKDSSQQLSYSQRQYLGGSADRFREIVEEVSKEPEPHPTLAQCYFYAASECHPDQERLLEKTPSHIFKADGIFSQFPKSKMVICARDPLDMVASYRKRLDAERALGKPEPEISWLDLNLDEMIEKFQSTTKRIDDVLERYPDRTLLVAYEWLTAKPESNIQRIYRFLGLDPEGHNEQPLEKLKADKADKLHDSPITQNASEVDKYLSADEIAKVEQETQRTRELYLSGFYEG